MKNQFLALALGTCLLGAAVLLAQTVVGPIPRGPMGPMGPLGGQLPQQQFPKLGEQLKLPQGPRLDQVHNPQLGQDRSTNGNESQTSDQQPNTADNELNQAANELGAFARSTQQTLPTLVKLRRTTGR